MCFSESGNRHTVYSRGFVLPDTGNQRKYVTSYNKGRVLDRDTILTRIWGFDYDGDTRVVDTHIKRIRKTLNNKGKNIVTKVNVGYMLEEK
ncbi:MAG TPA: hypothetical protein DCX93_01625 [Butyrivibrio sp.]|nr:hypothetical protein [Butyrivibrio sp.]